MADAGRAVKIKKRRSLKKIARREIKQYQLYLLLLLPVIYLLIFHYWPMYGVIIAFKDFNPMQGILRSPWVGFRHFDRFFNIHNFWQILSNTINLSLYTLIASFPVPIILALAVNSCYKQKFKKVVQMGTYMPFFLSTAIVVSMMYQLFALHTGVINTIVDSLIGRRISFLTMPASFTHMYVWSGVWQTMGFRSIIYIAALAGIDLSLHEAATVDGANRFRRLWHIDLPGILPTIVILLILEIGSVMNIGFEKVFLMQNTMNISRSQVISTYVYHMSIGAHIPNFSYSAAVGLFNSIINFVFLLSANYLANKFGDRGLF